MARTTDRTAAARAALVSELVADGIVRQEDGTLMLIDFPGVMVELTLHDVREEPNSAPARGVHLTTPAASAWD